MAVARGARRRTTPWIGRAAVAAFLGLVAGACAGAATPSPSPTPTPAPTATPTPEATPDVVAAFLEMATDEDLSAHVEVRGAVTVGTVRVTVEMSLRARGEDAAGTVVYTTGGRRVEVEVIIRGSEGFTRLPSQPWLPAPEGSATRTSDPFASIRGLSDLEDLGVERKEGRELHHLRPAGDVEVDPADLGLTPPAGVSDVTVAFERYDIFVEEDGTPVLFESEYAMTATTGGRTLNGSGTLEAAYSKVGEPVTIEVPDDVWTPYTSERFGYAIAHPEGWEISDENASFDDFYGQVEGHSGEVQVFYTSDVPEGTTLEAWAENLLDHLDRDLKATVKETEDRELGGAETMVTDFHYTEGSGTEIHGMGASALAGADGVDIFWFAEAGTEAAEPRGLRPLPVDLPVRPCRIGGATGSRGPP